MQTTTQPETVYTAAEGVNAGLQRATRAVFSFPVVLGALLVLMTIFTIRSRFTDPDTWWHLKAGEIIWNTHSIPRVDVFSFTAQGHPWVAEEWLSEFMLYGVWKAGGYTGLMLWFAIVASLLVLAAYVLCTLYSGNCKVAFLGGVVVWLFSTIGLAIRPHMIGYLLLICELIVIHLGRTRNARWFFAVPPILALWINLHGSYPLGLVVLGVVVFFSYFQWELGLLSSNRWPPEKRRMLTFAFGLSLIAPLANPIGWKLVRYPFDNMLHPGINFGSVEEWQQIDFSDFRGMALLAIAGLVLLIPLLRRIQLHAVELVLVALAFGLAVKHERMIFVFGILAAPVLCRLLATTWEGYDARRDNPWGGAIVLASIALAIVLGFPGRKNLEQQVDSRNPVKAVEFVRQSGLSGNMLNEFVFGGYLIWAMPEHKVSMDGRGDVYEAAGVLEEYGRWALLKADPNEFLDKYHIAFCFLSRSAPMARVLPLLPGWKKVYSDELAVVYTRGNR